MVVALSLFADVFVSSVLMPGHGECLARCPVDCQAIDAHDNATVHDQGDPYAKGRADDTRAGTGCHDTATIWFSLIVVLRMWRVFRIIHAVAEVSREPLVARAPAKAQPVVTGWPHD